MTELCGIISKNEALIDRCLLSLARALANGGGASLSPRLLIGVFTLEIYLRQVASMPKVTDPVWELTKNCSEA